MRRHTLSWKRGGKDGETRDSRNSAVNLGSSGLLFSLFMVQRAAGFWPPPVCYRFNPFRTTRRWVNELLQRRNRGNRATRHGGRMFRTGLNGLGAAAHIVDAGDCGIYATVRAGRCGNLVAQRTRRKGKTLI